MLDRPNPINASVVQGLVTHKGLDYYVAERVKQLTNGKQSPVSIAPAGIADFPIAVVGTN